MGYDRSRECYKSRNARDGSTESILVLQRDDHFLTETWREQPVKPTTDIPPAFSMKVVGSITYSFPAVWRACQNNLGFDWSDIIATPIISPTRLTEMSAMERFSNVDL
jgi:hypothetical protein